MEKKIIECVHIAIDCQENDRQDIRMGGPQYLGYDFYVEKAKAKEMLAYITKTMKTLKIPLLDIRNAGKVYKEEHQVWTEERIHKCLANNEAGLEF